MSLLPELRLVLAVSLDGKLAAPAGGAAQLGGRGDRRVLEEALAWADACLIGARTVRLHRNTCLIHRPDLLDARQRSGRPAQPIAVVASRSGVFEATLPFFEQPLRRWLLLGAAAGPLAAEPPPLLPLPPGFERLLVAPGWPSALARLRHLGLARVVVLGGADLAASLLAGGWVDELQLTLCPLLLGGVQGWCPAPGLPGGSGWDLVEHRALGGGELLVRYRRRSGPRPAQGA